MNTINSNYGMVNVQTSFKQNYNRKNLYNANNINFKGGISKNNKKVSLGIISAMSGAAAFVKGIFSKSSKDIKKSNFNEINNLPKDKQQIKKLLFKEDENGSYNVINFSDTLDKLQDRPDLLAKYLLHRNSENMNVLSERDCPYKTINEIHKKLKDQPDFLYEIYMTPKHGTYNRNNGQISNVLCFPSPDWSSKEVEKLSKNIIELAKNPKLSPTRSIKLLSKYEFINNNTYKMAQKIEDTRKKMEIKTGLNSKLINKMQETEENFKCAPGVEKYLHSTKEIDSWWDRTYIFGDNSHFERFDLKSNEINK